jgi:hypothetical protein
MSKIEVNTIDVQCGSTLTVGSSGKTVTLATGASQSGFGRTGTVDWCTTAKTGDFTAVSGDGFFVNTSGGAITVTLPSSPSAGDIVAFKDYGNTWAVACKPVTLCRNGSKINGACNNTVLNTKSQSVTLIYVDGTKGWQDIHDSTANITGAPNFIAATGGTAVDCGNFRMHVFTGDGNFVVDTAPTPANNTVDYFVVAGGGGGGGDYGGGGGGGGFRGSSSTYTDNNPLISCVAGLPVSVQSYPIQVGGGGVAGNGQPSPNRFGGTGTPSIFSSITSAGGGGGATEAPNPNPYGTAHGGPGGSGGGATYYPGEPAALRGDGNTPPTTPAQGNDGGSGSTPTGSSTGGGGGAGAAGGGGNNSPATGGNGGIGSYSKILGSTPTAPSYGTPGPESGGRYFAAGGAGSGAAGLSPAQPAVGGGGGGPGSTTGVAGTINTGGGGGGGYPDPAAGGAGGSGIVIVRYRFQ